MQLLIEGVCYTLWTPKDEQALEDMVKEHAKDIFGEDSIYFDIKKKIKTKAGIGSIPDGYVITFETKPCWYIVEVELSSHPLYEHIVPQMSKFIGAISDINTQRAIVDAMYNEIKNDRFLQTFVKEKIEAREIYEFLFGLISTPPILIIVIEEKTNELEEVCSNLRLNTKVVEFKTLQREGVGLAVHAHLFEPICKRTPIMVKDYPPKIEDKVEDFDTIVIPALEEGFKEVFLGQNCWYAIRISQSMLDKIKYIASYQVSPISAVTHYAEVSKIERYENTNKFILYFKEAAKEIVPIKLIPVTERGKVKPPYSARYTTFNKLMSSKNLDELF